MGVVCREEKKINTRGALLSDSGRRLQRWQKIIHVEHCCQILGVVWREGKMKLKIHEEHCCQISGVVCREAKGERGGGNERMRESDLTRSICTYCRIDV